MDGIAEEDTSHSVREESPRRTPGDPREKLCEGCAMKDGLHWTKAGHDKLGEALFQQIFSDCR